MSVPLSSAGTRDSVSTSEPRDVLMTNAPLQDGEHDLTDVTASILDYFGLRPLPGMVGTSFLAGEARPHSAPVSPGA